MFPVHSYFSENFCSLSEKLYTVEVVNFEGLCNTVTVFACNSIDAQLYAANLFDNVDYTNVMFCEVA